MIERREFLKDSVVRAELIGATMDDVVAELTIPWADGAFDADGVWGADFRVEIQNYLIVTGLRYRVADDSGADLIGPRYQPFGRMAAMESGDSLTVTLRI